MAASFLNFQHPVLRIVADSVQSHVCRCDLSGRIVSANASYAARFALTPSAIVGRKLVDVLGPLRFETVRTYFERACEGETVEYEFDESTPTGTNRRLHVVGTPEFDSRGAIEGVVFVLTDITHYHELQEALRRSEERYRALVEAITSIVWTMSADGRFVEPQPGWQEYTGQRRDEYHGDGWLSAIHEADREHVSRVLHEAIAKRSHYQCEARVWHAATGTYRHCEAHGVALFEADGSIREWVGKYKDVHDRWSAEVALRRSERLYRGIGESIDYGIWVCDADGRNIYASESFLKLVGITQQECSEFGWGRVLHPDDADATIAAWKECSQKGEFWEREHRFRGVDGRWHHVLARGVPIREEGRIVCWAGINLDIGALKEAQEALREADRRKDEFLATLAHELRNPLAPIRNAVEVLHLQEAPDSGVQWARAVIDRQVQQLTRLVDDLLDVSRITRGKVRLRRERVDLAVVVDRALETTAQLVESSGHRLVRSLPRERLPLAADITRMAQVLSNLINNAVKYSEPGGEIRVVAARRGADVEIRVEDDGIGIPAEMQSHVFDMFAQVDTSISRAQGGLGIGLTIVKRIVEMHGGTVSVRSEGIGKGSAFVVTVPLAPDAVPFAVPKPERRAARVGDPRRVLVVDDNADAADTMRMLLELMGHDARSAYDGRAAIRIAEEFRPELVLLDIGMPGMNGYEVAGRLRASDATRDATLVAVTGWGQADDRQRSRDAGFDHHLVKPAEPSALTALLAACGKKSDA